MFSSPALPRRALFATLFHLVLIAALHLAAPVRAQTPDSVPCPTCEGTGACQNNGCKDGKMLCPATCLKLESPGWSTQKIEGFPADYRWMGYKFKDDTGRIQYISHYHVGELIEYDGPRPVSRGRCPTCEGTSRVACNVCAGGAKCGPCGGVGAFVRNQSLFTLTDAQGRALEAVIRSRQGDTITVLRLSDQKVFDIPLARLSAESNEVIEQKFPRAP